MRIENRSYMACSLNASYQPVDHNQIQRWWWVFTPNEPSSATLVTSSLLPLHNCRSLHSFFNCRCTGLLLWFTGTMQMKSSFVCTVPVNQTGSPAFSCLNKVWGELSSFCWLLVRGKQIMLQAASAASQTEVVAATDSRVKNMLNPLPSHA